MLIAYKDNILRHKSLRFNEGLLTTVQETDLGGVREGKHQDFPTGPADGKWRTKGSVDAARRPGAPSEEGDGWEGSEGEIARPTMPALLQVAETSVIGTSRCDGQPSPRTISKTVSKETTPGMQGGVEREPTKMG